jgi:hypothetical protein
MTGHVGVWEESIIAKAKNLTEYQERALELCVTVSAP